LHVALRRDKASAVAGDDHTIVHPGKLSRARLEAICAACHLSDAVSVPLRGRGLADFRPGRPLTDYRTDYYFDQGDEQMTVVGHISQLRRSACYQKSSDLTCVTCHDPHAQVPAQDRIAMYRQKCMQCHQDQGCRLALEDRRKKQPADDCAACHMPRGDTDIPHVAFTHHRIGLHASQQPARPQRVPELIPTDDFSHLAAEDQQRNLGLAYVSVASDPRHAQHAATFRARGLALLEPLHKAGMRDPMVAYALAAVCFARRDRIRAAAYSNEALAAQDLPIDYRAESLVMRADCYAQEGQIDPAIRLLREVTPLRRRAEDWRLLGRLYLEQQQPDKALPALQQAVAIRPYRYDMHGGLAEAYRRLGDAPRYREHVEKAQWLLQQRQE
jgi:tetratricopeptide (TPR) repeat protein